MNSIFAIYTLYTFLLHYVQHTFSHNRTTILHVFPPNLLLRLLYYCSHYSFSSEHAQSDIYTKWKKKKRERKIQRISEEWKSTLFNAAVCLPARLTASCLFKPSWHLLDLRREFQDIKVHEKKRELFQSFWSAWLNHCSPSPTHPTCPTFKKKRTWREKWTG